MEHSCAGIAGRRFLCAAGLVLAGAALAMPLAAQRADSTRAAAATRAAPGTRAAPADSLKPPLSPRRAFVYSFLVPGYSQSVLGRHKTAAILLIVEGMSVSMIRESAADLREARRTEGDSLVASWTAAGAGGSRRTTAGAPLFTAEDVRSRRRHVEDWIALLLANHLFAGADAFVAANLWDLPVQLSLQATPSATGVVASMSW